jgi:hypothetical protein
MYFYKKTENIIPCHLYVTQKSYSLGQVKTTELFFFPLFNSILNSRKISIELVTVIMAAMLHTLKKFDLVNQLIYQCANKEYITRLSSMST